MGDRSVILTIGTFDGVHRGHARLAARTSELARENNADAVALVFDPHPCAVLRPGTEPARLSTFAQRERWLMGLGIDAVRRLDPACGVLSLGAADFVEQAFRQHRAVGFVEGPDFRFGKGREGKIDTLASLAAERGAFVEVVRSVEVALTDHHVVPARSTIARWLLTHGRVADAAAVLGRWYELTGTVVRGEQRGRTIGFPTANIRTDHLLPADGVYSGRVVLPGGDECAAAVSVGTKPTFNGSASPPRTLEAHVLTESPLAGTEYDWPITLRFTSYLRDQMRFANLDALKDQLARDVDRARALHAQTC